MISFIMSQFFFLFWSEYGCCGTVLTTLTGQLLTSQALDRIPIVAMQRRLPELAVVAVLLIMLPNSFQLWASGRSFHLFGASVVIARFFYVCWARSLKEMSEGSRIRPPLPPSPADVRVPGPSYVPSDQRPPGPPVISKALVLATRLNRVLFMFGSPSRALPF